MSKWMQAALIRAIRTWAQTALATIGYGAVRLGDVDWVLVVSAATLAAIISLLMSIAGLPEVELYYANLQYAPQEDEESEEDDNGDEVQGD